MNDYQKCKRPAPLTAQELIDKLAHLHLVLESEKKSGIQLTAEGAMRWLTGVRHEIIAVTPDGGSPVSALVELSGRGMRITFLTTPIEMPRVKDQLPPVFKGIRNVSIAFATALPKVDNGMVLPGSALHTRLTGQIVRPLIGGLKGNQYKKFDWVGNMMSALTVKTAYELTPGMNGEQVRGLLAKNFADYGVETNMLLIALKGQENHLHPLYEVRYKVPAKGWIKLVTAGRLADVIVSGTVMVKFGKITAQEQVAHSALQEAVIEYADLYRNGMNERAIYEGCGDCFKAIEKKHGLKGFAKSAYLHHLGGPTSPLGNRDYCLSPANADNCFAGMSFAINPVECLFGTKVEIQGIVSESGAPHMLDISKLTDPKLATFSKIVSANGTKCLVPDPVVR